MSGNSGGPWGGGGNRGGSNGGDDDDRNRGNQKGGRRPGENQIPEIDELMNKGREQLRVLMGGGNGARRSSGGGGGGGDAPQFGAGAVFLGLGAAVVLWGLASFYTVKPEERSVELFLGSYSSTGNPGLNFAPWPLVTYNVVNVTSERTESIGSSGGVRDDNGLMLTTDANIVDIGFQVVWNVSDPTKFLFNIRDPQQTVQAVSESAMREVIAASNLAPILNRDRGAIASTVQESIQAALNEYDAGINIVRVNLEKADPPGEVIDSFREVQAAEQQRDRLQREADAYANRVVAEARGQAEQVIQQAEGYRSQTVNNALGQASRFTAVQEQYALAPEVTRRRIYLETMEKVLGGVNKMILDPTLAAGGEGRGGTGVVPILPLNDLFGKTDQAATATTAGGN